MKKGDEDRNPEREKYKLDLVFCIIGRLVRWGSVFCPFAQGQREGERERARGMEKEKRGSREQNRKKTKNAGEMVSAIGDQTKKEKLEKLGIRAQLFLAVVSFY